MHRKIQVHTQLSADELQKVIGDANDHNAGYKEGVWTVTQLVSTVIPFPDVVVVQYTVILEMI